MSSKGPQEFSGLKGFLRFLMTYFWHMSSMLHWWEGQYYLIYQALFWVTIFDFGWKQHYSNYHPLLWNVSWVLVMGFCKKNMFSKEEGALKEEELVCALCQHLWIYGKSPMRIDPKDCFCSSYFSHSSSSFSHYYSLSVFFAPYREAPLVSFKTNCNLVWISCTSCLCSYIGSHQKINFCLLFRMRLPRRKERKQKKVSLEKLKSLYDSWKKADEKLFGGNFAAFLN